MYRYKLEKIYKLTAWVYPLFLSVTERRLDYPG